MASDAIIVGEDFVSEHYFTTEAKGSFDARVKLCRKEWDDAGDGVTSRRDAFLKARSELVPLFALLGEADAAAHASRAFELLLTGLGFDSPLYERSVTGPVHAIAQRDLDEPAPLVVIEGAPVEQLESLLQKDAAALVMPYEPAGEKPITSASRLLSTLFASDDGPTFALVLAGRWALLTERERWSEGRYLAIDLQLVADRNDQRKGGELDRALACLALESLMPDAEGTTWWAAAFDESVKHTVGVSQDLREGVRHSIEIIANEVVDRRRELGLEPLPADQAQPLAKQALRYLYRILFLLYAEASPELQVLPVGAGEYEEGYSLDRLRELVLVPLTTESDRTHFYDSLAVLFQLVDRGNHPPESQPYDEDAAGDGEVEQGLTFNALQADLFLPKAVALIDEVKLGDRALQRVLEYLLLSKNQPGRDRGFISYSDLGINQLGAVYEGLMSYTGFFATTDLHEVAKDGDASKGSWVVPIERSSGIAAKDFVQAEDPIRGEKAAVVHKQGSFVYRLAGRERQQSASYYTPEVLTRFVVSQALEELLDQDGHTTTSEEILNLTVCEPALGSGAFAIEAVRQLADEYLKRREAELGEKVDPEDRPRELQKVKAYIALHQVYGVDLNATAVELAEISLWLDTMVEGLAAPWFGLHLKRGNSLIGARRAVYSRGQVEKKTWLTDVPRDVPVSDLAENIELGRLAQGTAGAIHHFLLPAAGWGAAVDAKEAKELAPEAQAALKKWRSSIKAKPTKSQLDALVSLAYRVESLWQLVLRRLRIAETEIRREIPLWSGSGGRVVSASERIEATPVTRAEIESKLSDPNGAYQRLRRVMDAWNALWFWPLTSKLTNGVQPPTLDQWIAGLRAILGEHTEAKGKAAAAGQTTFSYASGSWEELNDEEQDNLDFASAAMIEHALADHPWLAITERIARQQGYFHWELDFATVFEQGGFNLQVGNPPWVRPDWKPGAALAEFDAWWALTDKPPAAESKIRRQAALADPDFRSQYLDDMAAVLSTKSFVGATTTYPHLTRLRPDLYRCFMEVTWRHTSASGIIGLVHPESHFTDEKAGLLRSATYQRLRRHWQFINELKLFEIDNHVTYGVHLYGTVRQIDFLSSSGLYHPETVARSLIHDGTGDLPGQKTPDGRFDTRPHSLRIVRVNERALGLWNSILEEPGTPVRETRMAYIAISSLERVLHQVKDSARVRDAPIRFALGIDETAARRAGVIRREWKNRNSWRDVILQGPHIHVSAPTNKTPNRSLKSNKDWTSVDLEALEPTFVPPTAYQVDVSMDEFDRQFPHWPDFENRSSRDFFRVIWRSMAANTGVRTLTPAIIPPGAAYVTQSVYALGAQIANSRDLAVVAGCLSSLIADYLIRVSPKSSIPASAIGRIPLAVDPAISDSIGARALRLNCLTQAHAELWTQALSAMGAPLEWAPSRRQPVPFGQIRRVWDAEAPVRIAEDRRQAQIEIDVLLAIELRLPIDDLIALYRSEFGVLSVYDDIDEHYDANGRSVPTSVLTLWRRKGDSITAEERTAKHPGSGIDYTYELPFVTLDREADMRQAYAHFERLLQEPS